jgi:hypothetical protein
MEKKNFFKSVSFKCIVTLLVIVLVSGILLTFCNTLFYVSADEKLQRAISKLYEGESVTYQALDVDSTVSTPNSSVNSIYEISTYEGDYLLNVTGEGGYSNGTVTCWVIVQVKDKAVTGIKNVSIQSNVNQSFIQNITNAHIQTVIAEQNNKDFDGYEVGNIKTGASYSLGAITNAMNGAVSYVNQVVIGTELKYGSYQYNQYIDEKTAVTINGTDITYEIVTLTIAPTNAFSITVKVGADKKVTEFAITKNGSTSGFETSMLSDIENMIKGKSLEEITPYIAGALDADGKFTESAGNTINTHATRSNFLCFYAAAFALANYDTALVDFSEGGNS